MANRPIKVSLNVNALNRLYRAIYDNSILTSQKNALLSNKPISDQNYDHNASNKSYAAVRRAIDTATHLNSMEFGKCEQGTIAFDFYEFLLSLDVMIHSVVTMAGIYDLYDAIEAIEKSSDIFSKYNRPNLADHNFFCYIRSLCAVHPCKTNRFTDQYHGQQEFHCCPCVIWDFDLSDGNLSAEVLTPDQDKDKRLHLDFMSFVAYLERWIELADKITDAVLRYIGNKCEEYRQRHILLPSECTSYTAYLENLIRESNLRTDNNAEWALSDFIKVLQLVPSNAQNTSALESYKHAIRLAVDYYHKRLQAMDDTKSEYTGIKHPEPKVETELIWEVHSPSYHDGTKVSTGRTYAFGKLSYLDGKHEKSDEIYARMLLEKQKEWINQYVLFLNDEPNKETEILVMIAEYLEAIEHDSLLNRNIPNDLKYRRTLREGNV